MKYEVRYTVERYWSIEIEADSREEALDKFHNSDVDWEMAHEYGSQLDDWIEVVEKEGASV